MKLLLEQHSHLFTKDALFFVGIHEEYLTDCLLLAKTSLEPHAIKLIKRTLELIAEVVKYESVWRVDYFQCVMSLMVSLSYSIKVFLFSNYFFFSEMHSEPFEFDSIAAASS